MRKLLVTLLSLPIVAYSGSLDPAAGPGSTMVTLQEMYGVMTNVQHNVASFVAPASLSADSVLVNAGFYEATTLSAVDPDLAANNLLGGVTVFGIQGAIANRGDGPTVTPTTSVQTVTSGYYGSDITVAGDTNLIAENIAEGVQIFGVTGSLAGGAGLLKTGQSTSYYAGDDGDLEAGTAWPNPRFTDHGDGTFTDEATGLMWMKGANNYQTWELALDDCNNLTWAGYTDWRLPNRREMESILDPTRTSPALPSGIPFLQVYSGNDYWTSTTYIGATTYAWVINWGVGSTTYKRKMRPILTSGCVAACNILTPSPDHHRFSQHNHNHKHTLT